MPNKKFVDREALKAFRKKTDDKYVIEGEYSPQTKVGYADEAKNLTPYGDNSGADLDNAYVMQTTGGGSDVGSVAYQRSLRGNSVLWNQFTPETAISKAPNGLTISKPANSHTITISGTANADAGVGIFSNNRLQTGHKVLFLFKNYEKTGTQMNLFIDANYSNWIPLGSTNPTVIKTITYDLNLQVGYSNGNTYGYVFDLEIFDLTAMFGAGNEPTTAQEFIRLFPLPYYEYNIGTLLSCKTNKVRNVGYNAYDNANPNAYIKVVAGQKYTLEGSGSVTLYDGNKTALSDTFTSGSNLPNNCQYVTISGGNSTTCFHLTCDGSRTGYAPYQKWEYDMPDVELKSVGKDYYEYINPDGEYKSFTVTKIETTDLDFSSLDWNFSSQSGSSSFFYASIPSAFRGLYSAYLVGKYRKGTVITTNEEDCVIDVVGTLFRIRDLSCGSSTTKLVAQLTRAVAYGASVRTVTQNDAYKYQESQKIDDFGTQEALSSVTESASSPIIPQRFNFFYPVDYKAFIDSLGERVDIDYDASQLVSQEQLTAEKNKTDIQWEQSITLVPSGGNLSLHNANNRIFIKNNILYIEIHTQFSLADGNTLTVANVEVTIPSEYGSKIYDLYGNKLSESVVTNGGIAIFVGYLSSQQQMYAINVIHTDVNKLTINLSAISFTASTLSYPVLSVRGFVALR